MTTPYDRPAAPVPEQDPTDRPGPMPEQAPGYDSPIPVGDPPMNPDTPGMPVPDPTPNSDTPGLPSPMPAMS